MHPTITTLDDDDGLSLYDPVENARFVLYANAPLAPSEADPDGFAFPIETAVSVETDELVVPKLDPIHVRTTDGRYCDEFRSQTVPRYAADDDRLLEFTSTPLKLYLLVPGPFEIVGDVSGRNTVVSLPETDEIIVGVRSFHERPAHTIETPAEPEAVMRALSKSGSALKTLSCERSFPTLRGHPPAFEVADELSIPDGIESPDTGVTVWVPPKWEFVYPIAPLVYYLGAKLRPGGPPCIEVGDWTYSLGGPGIEPEAFQQRVVRALQKVFFMDCLTRTEGFYPVELHERAETREVVDLDFGALYDAPLATQVRTFLDVSYEAIESHLPTWHLCVDVDPSGDLVEALPYLLDDLALIRCRIPVDPPDPAPEMEEAFDDFVRSRQAGSARPQRAESAASEGESFVRSTSDPSVRSLSRSSESPSDDPNPVDDVFTPEPAPAMEQAYLGEWLPFRQNKLSVDVLERRLDYDEPTSGSIDVRIVCNDERMAEEAAVEEYYGVHDLVEYDVDIAYDLTCEEFTDVLRADVDLLHYVGHVDERGFACADGHFHARDLDAVGVETFLLNACNSYVQGQALLDAGAAAGLTSLNEVNNDAATRMGRTVARTLNAGFSLRSALALSSLSTSAISYLVLGDGGRQLVQCESGVPVLVDVFDADHESSTVGFDLFTFPAQSRGQGTFASPTVVEETRSFLTFGHLDQFRVTVDDFVEYLSTQSFPITADGSLYWSNELNRERLNELLADVAELRAGGRSCRRIADYFGPLRGED